MGHFRKPAPVGSHGHGHGHGNGQAHGHGKKGLSTRQPLHKAPAGASPVSQQARDDFKKEALRHAYEVSYAMQPRAWFKNIAAKVGHGTRESALGGKFLRMYLDHKLDPDVVKDAGQEIGESAEFKALAKHVQDYVQQKANAHKRLPSATEVEDEARRYLQDLKKKKGIAFRGALNPVIGGVGGVDVVRGQAKLTPSGQGLDYEIQVKFSDTYDFDNKRSGIYDQFRKHLAALVQKGQFDQFWSEYHAAAGAAMHSPFSKSKYASIGAAGIFASFMYAIEKNGLTPGGLPWDVTIPMSGSVHGPAQKMAAPKNPLP